MDDQWMNERYKCCVLLSEAEGKTRRYTVLRCRKFIQDYTFYPTSGLLGTGHPNNDSSCFHAQKNLKKSLHKGQAEKQH